MSEWQQYILEDLGKIITGKTPPSRTPNSFGGNKIPFLTPKDMNGAMWASITERYLTDEGLASVKSNLVKPKSVAVSCIGSDMGKAILVEKYTVTNQQINTIIVDEKRFNPVFIYYVLSTKQSDLKSIAGGSATPILNKGHFSKFQIDVPSKPKQDSIAKVLKALDDKIENNRRMNETLEGMAQAIFKSWFVDFDPVHAKVRALKNGGSEDDARIAAMCAISGKTADALALLKSKNPDEYADLARTADAFPSTFTDSELGDIPMGWEVGTIGDLAKAKGGYAFKGKDFQENGNPVIKIKNITSDGKVIIEGSQCIDDTIAEKAKRFALTDGDLIMAMTGATVAKSGIVVSYDLQPFLNQRVAKFESEQFGKDISWYLFCLFRRDDIFSLLVSAAQGSAQPNISSSGIEGVRSIIPSAPLIESFCLKTKSLFIYWIKNEEENQSLAETRDALLPKLLSGEIDVNKMGAR